MMQRIYIYLPELKNKSNPNYIMAKDLIANIKLLCFINNDEIDNFFCKIKKKYEKQFNKLFNYFDNTYHNNIMN